MIWVIMFWIAVFFLGCGTAYGLICVMEKYESKFNENQRSFNDN